MREDPVNFRQGVGVAGVLRARDGSRSGGGQLGERALPELEVGFFAPWEIHTKSGAGMASRSRKTVPERQRAPSSGLSFLKVHRFIGLRIHRPIRSHRVAK